MARQLFVHCPVYVFACGVLPALSLSFEKGPTEQELHDLWAASVECWDLTQVGRGRIFFQPYEKAVHGEPQPVLASIMSNGHMFAITAYNPLGKDLDANTNLMQNRKLEADIAAMTDPSPASWWPSFGFMVADAERAAWREDGFTVAFDKEHMQRGRAAVLDLAKKYKQGAIYEFYDEGGILQRRTVPAELSSAVDEIVPLTRVMEPEDIPLSLAEITSQKNSRLPRGGLALIVLGCSIVLSVGVAHMAPKVDENRFKDPEKLRARNRIRIHSTSTGFVAVVFLAWAIRNTFNEKFDLGIISFSLVILAAINGFVCATAADSLPLTRQRFFIGLASAVVSANYLLAVFLVPSATLLQVYMVVGALLWLANVFLGVSVLDVQLKVENED